ncbi:MAG: hypothetical protein JXB49_11485 [Bacteroidales bacterium]|nr:hypothetical protein [Bacteroidales bacterium]
MKKIFTILALLIIGSTVVFSQKINNVEFSQTGDKLLVTYSLSGLKSDQLANVTLYVSTDGGKTFKGPLSYVSGDVGENVKGGNKKSIEWEALKEIPDFGGNVVFDVRATITGKEEKTTEEKTKTPKTHTEPGKLGMYAGLNGSVYAPFGITIGVTKGKFGGYFSGRLNQNYFDKADYTYDRQLNRVLDYDINGYYFFNGNDEFKRFIASAGILFMPHKNLGCYVGAGFSTYELFWEINEYRYPNTLTGHALVSEEEENINGMELECGLIVNYKKFYFGLGVSTPHFNWFEGTATLGFKIF